MQQDILASLPLDGAFRACRIGGAVFGLAVVMLPLSASSQESGAAAGSVMPTRIFEDTQISCDPDGYPFPRVLVSIEGFDDQEGNVRVQVYSDNPDEFLEKGTKLVRADVPVSHDNMKICIPVPEPGRYAFVVLHDRNANGRADFFTEGFGFSNNPKLGLSAPDHSETVTSVGAGVTEIDVRLTYVFDLEPQKAHRRRRR